jgi:hypothetical protein
VYRQSSNRPRYALRTILTFLYRDFVVACRSHTCSTLYETTLDGFKIYQATDSPARRNVEVTSTIVCAWQRVPQLLSPRFSVHVTSPRFRHSLGIYTPYALDCLLPATFNSVLIVKDKPLPLLLDSTTGWRKLTFLS